MRRSEVRALQVAVLENGIRQVTAVENQTAQIRSREIHAMHATADKSGPLERHALERAGIHDAIREGR